MFKISYVRNKLPSDDFNFHLDKNEISKGKLMGWFFDEVDNKSELLLSYHESKKTEKIVLKEDRPRLATIYPDVKNINPAGFSLSLDNIDEPFAIKLKKNDCLTTLVTAEKVKPLLFVHIAKTAGSTVNDFLTEAFGDKNSLIHVESNSSWKNDIELNNYHFVSGHFTYTQFMASGLFHDYEKAITFRNPFNHVVSHLSWVRALSLEGNEARFNAHPEYIQVLSKKLSKCDFTKPDSISELINNLNHVELKLLDNTQTRYVRSDITKERVDDKDVLDSIENLGDFKFIGIDSDIDGFLKSISDFYDFEKSNNNMRSNTLSNKFGLDLDNEDVKNSLLPLIDKDIVLYKKVKNYI